MQLRLACCQCPLVHVLLAFCHLNCLASLNVFDCPVPHRNRAERMHGNMASALAFCHNESLGVASVLGPLGLYHLLLSRSWRTQRDVGLMVVWCLGVYVMVFMPVSFCSKDECLCTCLCSSKDECVCTSKERQVQRHFAARNTTVSVFTPRKTSVFALALPGHAMNVDRWLSNLLMKLALVCSCGLLRVGWLVGEI